ncbi:glycosyltransferase [[Micrococcus luteus] ATCC 49442]|uniref:glycosyltransferase n=1 Tax=[Micrococcus luteus] ATCC 49442 TaxID=2698727 RepID=UPI0013DCE58F|nr:glycosyltransferase family 2 protein [[Micrococcus luteus] ATCC 49442]
MTPTEPAQAEYILPLRWSEDSSLEDITTYLEQLSSWIPVTVVDGSTPNLFDRHRARFPASVRHIRPRPGPRGNGKVTAVLTAVSLSSAERLVIADDDVRYTREGLRAVIDGLDHAHVVRPQNYFSPLPWHACWDTARSLMNRAFADDFPGTLAVRRDALAATGGYDAVLFENLELIRTVTAAGGYEQRMPALFIARRPPTSRHFLRQRIRHAYDGFAQPGRLWAELALLPLLASVLAQPPRRAVPAILAAAAAAVALAETGRRRHQGRRVFPARTVLFAPLWVAERAVCIWIALALRIGGGVPYAGARLKTAAHSTAELRIRHSGKIPPHPAP